MNGVGSWAKAPRAANRECEDEMNKNVLLGMLCAFLLGAMLALFVSTDTDLRWGYLALAILYAVLIGIEARAWIVNRRRRRSHAQR